MAASDRPVFVFAHYFGGSARSWSPVLEALGDGCETIAPDLPGFGGSPRLPEGPDLDGYIDHFAGLAEGRPWVAVGHSMGGKIALGAAARSNTMAGLILIAPSPPTPEPMSEDDREEMLASYGQRNRAEARVRKSSNDALTRDVFDIAVADQMRVDESVWRWWLERGSRDDISRRTASVDTPTLVLFGDADRVLGSTLPRTIASDLKDALAAPIPRGSHLVPLEQPGVVAARIDAFVSYLPSPQG